MINLFLGNLSWEVTEKDLRQYLEGFGEIRSVKVMTDRETGKPRGFAFAEFVDREAGEKAMRGVNGLEFMGRDMNVEEARPRPTSGRERYQDRGRQS